MQAEALRVADAWGFKVSSELVWIKPQLGMGHYVRNSHEVCLVCTRKGSAKLVKAHNVRSYFTANRGRHSAKPDEFYDLVERLFEGPYVELFARRHRAGWACFGDEL